MRVLGTIAAAMVVRPLTHGPDLTVDDARAALTDPQRHLLLLVADGRLVGTLTREDLVDAGDGTRCALTVSRLAGRTVRADADLARTHADMRSAGVRRLAVVGADDDLLGLLCLKASGTGFCSDAGIAARARARALDPTTQHLGPGRVPGAAGGWPVAG